MMRRIIVLAALAAFSPGIAGAAEIVMAVGRSLPPYVISDTWRGLEYDVVKAALKTQGHTVRPRLMAFARVVKEMDSGLVDAAMTMRPDSGVKACYSDSHVTYRNYAITLASNPVRINAIKDLADKSVMAFQNASIYLGQEYRDTVGANPRYREEAKQAVQPLLLYLSRVDVVVSDRYIFGWFAASPEVAGKADTTQALRYHPIFPPTDYHVAFRSRVYCDAFNRGLAQLRQSGEYDRIVNHYARYLGEDGSP